MAANSSQGDLAPFAFDTTLARFDVPCQSYISKLRESGSVLFRFIAVGALVFNSEGRVLLVQRAATDFLPNLWETPGGACDEGDPSILHAVARELLEEAGLTATRIGPLIDRGDYVFPVRGGEMMYKFNFIVDVRGNSSSEGPETTSKVVAVKLDPTEHQNHVWATYEDVLAGKVGDLEIKMTSTGQRNAILDAFEARSKMQQDNALAA